MKSFFSFSPFRFFPSLASPLCLLLALVGVQLSRNWRQKATSTQRTHRVRRGHRLIIVVLLLLSRSRARGRAASGGGRRRRRRRRGTGLGRRRLFQAVLRAPRAPLRVCRGADMEGAPSGLGAALLVQSLGARGPGLRGEGGVSEHLSEERRGEGRFFFRFWLRFSVFSFVYQSSPALARAINSETP